jgi:hypothetical protein
MIAHFDVETPLRQWYGDTSFNDFGFDYGGTVGASSSHPLLLTPLLWLILMKMKVKRAENKMKKMSEAS